MSNREYVKPRKRSFSSTMAAIAWSFIGLRRRKDFDDDVAGGMNPLYVIIGALITTAFLIATLLIFVKLAVS